MVLTRPRKVRQLIAELLRAGFAAVPAKGSHRKFRHSAGTTVIISGQTGADAHCYQEKEVRRAIAQTQETKP